MMGAPRELGVPFLKALVVMDTRLQEVQQLSIYKTFILQNRVKVQVIIPLAQTKAEAELFRSFQAQVLG